MKSVRLDPELEVLLANASRAEGMSASEFIREALRRRCAEVLRGDLAADLEELGVIGAASLGGGQASKTGQRFVEALVERREARR